MSINPPEGIYPGCTALSGLAEPGRSIVVRVPGYACTVRAIVSSPVRSPNGLTLTIDSAGQARVFGVGSVQTQARTTDFLRVRRRSADEPSRAIVAYILVQSQAIGQMTAGSIAGNYLNRHYLILPNTAPILIPFEVQEYVPASPAIVYPGYDNTSDVYQPSVFPFVSVNANDPNTIHVDFVHTSLTEPDYDELALGADLPTQVTSFRYTNGVLTAVDSSVSWRSPYFVGLQVAFLLASTSIYGYYFTPSQDWRRILALDKLVSWDAQRDYYFLINDRENTYTPDRESSYVPTFPDFRSASFYGFEPSIVRVGQTAPASTAHLRTYQLVNPAVDAAGNIVTATLQAVGLESAIGFESPSDYGLFYGEREIRGIIVNDPLYNPIANAALLI